MSWKVASAMLNDYGRHVWQPFCGFAFLRTGHCQGANAVAHDCKNMLVFKLRTCRLWLSDKRGFEGALDEQLSSWAVQSGSCFMCLNSGSKADIH